MSCRRLGEGRVELRERLLHVSASGPSRGITPDQDSNSHEQIFKYWRRNSIHNFPTNATFRASIAGAVGRFPGVSVVPRLP